MTWQVEHLTGSAADLHLRDLPSPLERTVWLLRVDRPALVLGSTQADDVVDAAAVAGAGVEVVRRRSGGGAVLLQPGDLWVDVLLARGDPLWHDDVGRAAHWLGVAWAAALGGAARVHRGPLVRTAWSDLVCFAGVGAGEVTAGEGGPKLVGISQRRTRAGVRFQCAALARWDVVGILGLLALGPGQRARAAEELAGAAAGVELAPSELLAHLP